MKTSEAKIRKIILEVFKNENILYDFSKYTQYKSLLNNPSIDKNKLNNSSYAKYNKNNVEWYEKIIDQYGKLEIHISRATKNKSAQYVDDFINYINQLCNDAQKVSKLFKKAV